MEKEPSIKDYMYKYHNPVYTLGAGLVGGTMILYGLMNESAEAIYGGAAVINAGAVTQIWQFYKGFINERLNILEKKSYEELEKENNEAENNSKSENIKDSNSGPESLERTLSN